MKIYLDNCCYNRPFDDQSQIRIKLEADAKLYIQNKVLERQFELVWSYILDYENEANPFEERKNAIKDWKKHAILDIVETQEIIDKSNVLIELGIKSKDALHLACAIIMAQCDYFITTDDGIIKKTKNLKQIAVLTPLTFISVWEE